MAKYTLPDFAPELRVVARGTASNRLVLSFDTATDIDLLRSPRVVMVDTTGVLDISTIVDDLQYEDSVLRRYATGKISLLTNTGEGEPVKHLLANFKLALECDGKRDKGGKLNFPPEHEIEQVVRQGVADAFADASLDMVADPVAAGTEAAPADNRRYEGGASQSWMPRPALAYAAGGTMRTGVAKTKTRMSKMMLAFLGLLGVLLLVAVFKIMAAPSDPVQVAVNKALANDPRARDEQIEITRQTLREMGLDPGKNGDLGCLAAQ